MNCKVGKNLNLHSNLDVRCQKAWWFSVGCREKEEVQTSEQNDLVGAEDFFYICLCVCLYVCLFVSLWVLVCLWLAMHVYMYFSVCLHVFACVFACVCVSVCVIVGGVCVFVTVCMRMYLCVSACVPRTVAGASLGLTLRGEAYRSTCRVQSSAWTNGTQLSSPL